MSDNLKAKLKAITRARRFVVRLVSEPDIEELRAIGTHDWCVFNGRQVAWSKRPCGQWVIFVL